MVVTSSVEDRDCETLEVLLKVLEPVELIVSELETTSFDCDLERVSSMDNDCELEGDDEGSRDAVRVPDAEVDIEKSGVTVTDLDIVAVVVGDTDVEFENRQGVIVGEGVRLCDATPLSESVTLRDDDEVELSLQLSLWLGDSEAVSLGLLDRVRDSDADHDGLGLSENEGVIESEDDKDRSGVSDVLKLSDTLGVSLTEAEGESDNEGLSDEESLSVGSMLLLPTERDSDSVGVTLFDFAGVSESVNDGDCVAEGVELSEGSFVGLTVCDQLKVRSSEYELDDESDAETSRVADFLLLDQDPVADNVLDASWLWVTERLSSREIEGFEAVGDMDTD